ncbi:formamidopyrimidine-DNA glycosylase isoform X3 [Sesamum indicum]|uniref:Formamidopyrimidine-DNA glycosylase isoform X3 n=1 Tax=Sesamum indicum TaxID=4182 RepID=A0A6I9SSV9_SESIN|nr:formamidopyrimidine-DNA glycosylase isoform X3 [Sesamum indicum]
MPELPEVEAARRALEEHCVGKRIKKSTVADDSKVIDGVSSKDFEAALVGKTIVAAHRKGKNMWLQLDSPPFPSFQFGMAGALYIKGVAVTKYKRSAVKDTDEWPSKYSKVFVELDGGLEFSFTDKRRFAKVRLLDNPASVPPISELGPDALLEPMTVDRFYNSLTKKKIGIKALLLDQSFISGIGNWMADEVLYQSRTHPLQTASSMSKEACAALLKCINEVTNFAVQVDADSLRFPDEWLFHFRWGKKPGKVNGKKIEFITAGSRTTAYVPELQKLTGNQAVKEAGKPSKRTAAGNSNADDESGDEDKPIEPKAVGGRKTGRTRKPSAMKKPSTSVSDSDDDEENSADDVTSKRKQGAKNPPARSKAKGLNENKGQRRQTKGRTAPAKRKHEESDHDTISSSGGDNEDQHEEAEEVMNGKRRGAGASSKKRVAISQNRKQKQNAK